MLETYFRGEKSEYLIKPKADLVRELWALRMVIIV